MGGSDPDKIRVPPGLEFQFRMLTKTSPGSNEGPVQNFSTLGPKVQVSIGNKPTNKHTNKHTRRRGGAALGGDAVRRGPEDQRQLWPHCGRQADGPSCRPLAHAQRQRCLRRRLQRVGALSGPDRAARPHRLVHHGSSNELIVNLCCLCVVSL